MYVVHILKIHVQQFTHSLPPYVNFHRHFSSLLNLYLQIRSTVTTVNVYAELVMRLAH